MSGNDSFTVSLLHFNGTDASTTFTDSNAGGSAHTWTANGNAQIDTAQSKFGGASGLFDGTGDYISSADSADWTLGTGDFTVDFWIRYNSVATYQLLFSMDNGGSGGELLCYWYQPENNIYFQCGSTNASGVVNTHSNTNSWSASTGTWYHVAIVRSGNSLYMFVGGTQLAGSPFTITGANIPDYTSGLFIGARSTATGTQNINGWMDEFRLSKGVARWTANFTPPTAEYDAISGTPLRTLMGAGT